MKRSGTVKFPNSVQLFKFCQKVLSHKKGGKIRDQEIGAILNYNPSDCSHWKRGEKNVRSVFSLASLAQAMDIETAMVHDVAFGTTDLDEAYFEYSESSLMKTVSQQMASMNPAELNEIRTRTLEFVNRIISECEFQSPPLYLPEVMRTFSFVSTQPVDMIDKLSRILRVRPGAYVIQFKKGELKAQTRMSMVKDLSRIIFEGERERFPELGALDANNLALEQVIFTTNLLAPKAMIVKEMAKLDVRRNVVAELAGLFWAPKSLMGFQIQKMLQDPTVLTRTVLKEETTSYANL
ncbi:MAG: hypothetical protein AB7T49_09800 [Oligoflexales bacterium]